MAEDTPSRRPSYLSPTKASLARYNPRLLSPSKSANGKKALDYVLGRSDGAPEDEQQHEPTGTVREPHELLSSTPGTRLQREVDKVIEGVEQAQTPEMARRFLNTLNEEEDDLPTTPEGARYSPPKGILSSGPRRKRKRTPETVVDIERPATRARLSEEPKVHPTQESAEIITKRDMLATLKAERDQLSKECTALGGILSPLVNDPGYQGLKVDELLPLLTLGKTAASGAAAQPPISQQLASFLPFAIPTTYADTVTSPSAADELVSCAPLPHNNINNLRAHLKHFTPFDIKSETESLTTDQWTGNDIQVQHVTISAPHFTAKIMLPILIFPTSTSTYINGLRFPPEHLSPWAAPELSQWLQQRPTHDDFSMLHILGEYYDFAIRRAKTWAKIAVRFPEHIKGAKPDSEEEYHVYLGRKSIAFAETVCQMQFTWVPEFDESTWEVKDRVLAKASLRDVEELFMRCLRRDYDVFEAISATVSSVFEL